MNQKHASLIILATLITLTSTACSNVEEVNSSDIDTSGIWARFAVHSTNDDSATAIASLLVGGPHSNTYIKLDDTDKLEVWLNGAARLTMVQDPTSSQIVYQSTLDANNAGTNAASYRFNFKRENKINAFSSNVTLPAVISNIQFNPAETFSRGSETITVTWDNVEEATIKIDVSGNCINSYSSGNIADSGLLSFTANQLTSPASTANNTCPLTFKFSRTNQGTIDAAFGEGGEITAYLSREADISSTP